jgi:YidC/Oxa1 family membrane protein insertase
MEKRVLIMVLLMTAVIMTTNLLFPPRKEPPAGAARADSAAAPGAAAPAARAPVLPAGVQQAPAQQVVVSSPLYRYTFSTRGASLVGARMLRYASARQDGQQVELVPAGSAGMLAHRLVVGRDTVDLRGLPFQASATRLELREGAGPQQLRFTYGGQGGLGVEVVYTFRPGDYLVDVAGRVTGTSGGTLITRLGPGLATRDAAHDIGVVVMQGEEIERFSFDDVEERQALAGPLSWVGVKDKYFLAAVVAGRAPNLQEVVLSPLPGERAREPGGESVVLPRLEVQAALPLGRDGAFAYSAWVGPQEHERLTAVGFGLEEVTPYGYAWLRPVVRPIASATLWVMRELHGTLGVSYGWVLIIIGVLVKLLLWPLNAKAMRAQMKNMAVQPLVQEIQTKYKNDPEMQQKEMIRLYKEHGFNPVAGCLPLLIPMPIFITLYFVFQNAIEFRGVPWAWLPDLSQKDPYYVIAILFIASTFVLQWVSTKLSGMETNPQMKMMMYVMPVAMGVFFINMASGLNLYYTASNLAGLPQQVLIARERRRANDEMKAKKAEEEAAARRAAGPTAPASRQQKRRK